MIDERQEEMAALAALGLLEGAEKTAFKDEMARNPELARRVDELRAAAARLAYAATPVEPPQRLKNRILMSAKGRPQSSGAQPQGSLLRFPALVPWALAACLAVAVAWSAWRYSSVKAQNVVLNERQASFAAEERDLLDGMAREKLASSKELAQLQAELGAAAADWAGMRVDLLPAPSGDANSGLAVAVWNPSKREGILFVMKLPPKPPGHDYQLWIIPDGPHAAPVSAGLVRLGTAEKGRVHFSAAKPMAGVAKFAVSLEREGGAPAPAGPIVLLSKTSG